MSIEYVEIRDTSTEIVGIIDTAKSVIWHPKYFGVGDFEIYAQATPEIIELLQAGYFVTRPDDLEVGVIETLDISENPQDGTMVTAAGRFAKSILDRRLIYTLVDNTNHPAILRGNVEIEVRAVVRDNAISSPYDPARNIPLLALGDLAGIPLEIVDADGDKAQKQATARNLLEYTDEVLAEYGLGSMCYLDTDAKKLRYVVYAGVDRSADNTDGNDPIIFSKEFDNLGSSSYQLNAATEKNFALIGGEGEGVERFFTFTSRGIPASGLQRREMFIDASSINKAYKDENDAEQVYSDADYQNMLRAAGAQTLAQAVAVETFSGAIDITSSPWQYNRDFALGDFVTVQNNEIGKYARVRLLDVLEVQDENGYRIEANNQT